MAKKGLFLTFEGVDGCGKSTQMKFLAEYLVEKGFEVATTREPGGCAISEKIRGILLDVENDEMRDDTEALLYAAARMQHAESVILPAMAEGKILLCDRYIDSSIAYQGYGRGLGEEWVRQINARASAIAWPDATFFFDLGPEEAWARSSKRRQQEEPDRLEQGGAAFYQKIYEGYQKVLAAEPDRVIRVDVSGTKEETKAKMQVLADQLVEKWQAAED